MEDNQPTTAREWLSRKRREEFDFRTQDPTNGADFDKVIADAFHDGVGYTRVRFYDDGASSLEYVPTDQWFNESARFEDHIDK